MKETINRLYKEWRSLQPLKETDQQRLNQKFMLEFNYNSNHIEGNTLTYGQTELLLLFGKVVDEANMKDLEEMKAHNVGLRMAKEEALNKDRPLTENFIRTLHQTLLREDYTVHRQLPDGTTTSYIVHAGRYKTRPNSVITVTGEHFEYASPEETPALMSDLIAWYNEEEKKGCFSPIELASVFHYRYIRIHPFEDGNGRIARLLVNYILYRHYYPMLVVQSKEKEQYLSALNKCDIIVGAVPSDGAHATFDQLSAFTEYMERCLIHSLEMCIKAAKGEDIEEDDDFEKRIKVLERLQQRPIKLNMDEFYRLEKIFKNLSDKIKEKMIHLNKFFHEIEASVFVIAGNATSEVPYGGFVIPCTCCGVNKNFIKEDVKLMYEVKVIFEETKYRIQDIDKEYAYGMTLTQNDIKNIVKIVCNGLLEQLEQKIK